MDENCAIVFSVAKNCSSAATLALALEMDSLLIEVSPKVCFKIPGDQFSQCVGKLTLRDFLFGGPF